MNWFFGFVLFACERFAANSEVWPQGTYGLPKPVTGCPNNWQDGWINQDLENTKPSSKFSSGLQLHMEATLTGGDIKRGFCIKTQIGQTRSWPKGSYCVYQKNQCPSGMKTGSIKWDDEDNLPNKNGLGGTLPDGTFKDDTLIFFCCQDQGFWNDSIELPIGQPFYLLPHKTSNCQRVKGAISTLEFIIYDTEASNNQDLFTGSHVFANTDKDGITEKGLPKIYYCYYIGCQHKFQNETGTISSTHFPDYQYCSWSITVNQGLAVSLTFTSINIPSCDRNYIDIYDGLDDAAPLLVRFCGNNATSGIKLLSTGNNIFIMLQSGRNSPNSGQIHFQADYKSTTPFSGLSWPSGTYGLPKTSTSCPDMWIPGWRKQIMEDDSRLRETVLSSDLLIHMDASLVDYALTRHFCTKTTDSGTSQTFWPAGKYCIYKKNQCPHGMNDGHIKWDDEDHPKNDKNDKHGILPDGDFDAQDANTKIYYCCNDQGNWRQSIELPINEPFYLLPHKSDNCQRVKWALSTLEYITYHTEKDNNHNEFDGSHVYRTSDDELLTIYYCYYKGCKYTFENDSGSFGTNDYPEYQKCSWSVTVKHSLEVVLEFISLKIPDCSESQLEIYDGVDSIASLLGTYCGENATSGNTLRSTGNTVYIIFKSGTSGGSLGFQARYKAEEPITEPAWPSGTYGLPKTTVGCPPGWVQGSRKQDMERSSSPFLGVTSSQFDMDAVLDLTGKYITRKFCMKTVNDGKKLWPDGSYCIYKKGNCPTGMSQGSIHWDDEDTVNANKKDGILPDGDYINNEDTEIHYCCLDQGNWYDPIELPFSVPFFLLPHKSKNCQRVKWAMSTLEYITYDTENDQNRDAFTGSHVYSDERKTSPTIYYCYYEGCQYKINADSPWYIAVSSTSNRDFQHCSWLLSVSHGNITLTFNSWPVQCSKNNLVELYDGANKQSPFLLSVCGTTVGTRDVVTSTGRHLFLLVKSGNNAQMETTVGFNATFKNNLPFYTTVAPSTTDIKTGKTTIRTTVATTDITTATTKATTTATKATTAATTMATTKATTMTTIKVTTKATTMTTIKVTTKATTAVTTKATTKATTTATTTAKTTATTPVTTVTSTRPSTLTQILTTSKLPTSARKTASKGRPTISTTNSETRSSTHQTSLASTESSTQPDVTTLPDVRSSQNPEKSTKPDITTTNIPNEGGQGKSSGDDNSSSLVIVIPVCVTVVAVVLIVMVFYQRRQRKHNSTPAGTTGDRIQLSNPEYDARFQSPGGVSFVPKGGQQVNVPWEEKNNPIYESEDNHTYCTIDDVQGQYKKELGLTNSKPSQSTLYETPADPNASTSTINPYAEGGRNLNLYHRMEPFEPQNVPQLPPMQGHAYDTPSPSTPSSSNNTPQGHYKTPINPYNTKLPKKDTQSDYEIPIDQQTTDSSKQPPQASYENLPKSNNNPHYQTPSTKPAPEVYEDMTGTLKRQIDLPDTSGRSGMTEC